MLDHFKFALISLKEKKMRSWLTLVGILIGVAAVVALIGLGEGLRTAITSQFGVTSTEILTVQAGGLSNAGPPGTGVITPLTQDDALAIEKLSTVEFVLPRILQSGKLEYNDHVIFGFATSVLDGEKRRFMYAILDVETIQGRMLKDGDNDKVVLGYNFYVDQTGLEKPVRVGDTVLIQDKKFEVVGIMKKKGSFIFDNIVLMNEKPLQELFSITDRVDIIAVKIKDKSLIEQGVLDIEKLMRQRRDVKVGEEDFTVQTPEAILESLNSVLLGVQIFIVIIASISIIVGALGVINTMLTAVLERKSQIGIMKAIGAKNSDIFLLFFFESGILGLIGGAIGVFFGTLISYFGTLGINSFIGSSTTPGISLTLILGALAGSFIIGAVAGILPALRAANQNPVDAIRG